MELAQVPELGSYAQKLTAVGVPSAEALAVWEDLPALANAVDVDVERADSFRDAARQAIERALTDAGVGNPEALAVADIASLAARTNIERAYLEHYQRKARDALGKVVLVDGAPVARVHLKEDVHHAVALVTASAMDSEDEVLGRAGGDAVLLKPDAEAVPAVIGGVTHRALPLYKERRKPDGQVEEVRVRVAQIREVPQKGEDKKGGIGRMFSKKGK
ncbi:MAG TPA: hypothetical protein VM370_13180 [Candidatus Thermoplasmatota archaeon]|nr:hypothetical protein [Candidatus Thermoplasmatota archaeon]